MNFKDLENIYKNYIENKFHNFSALIASWVVVGLFFVLLHKLIKDEFDYEWLLMFFVETVIFVKWLFFKYKYPKNNGKKNGLILSFYSENTDEVRLKKKFIRELERKLDENGIKNYFNIIEIKNHHSKNIKNKEDVDQLHKKVKGHLYLFGDIKKENENNKDIYFIDLQGYVRHLPVPILVSKDLSIDFSTLLPKEINIDKLFEFKGCKVLADLCVLTVGFVVGSASLISRNPFLALKLHLACLTEINKEKFSNHKHLGRIKNKLPLLISVEYIQIANIYFYNNDINKTKENLLLALKYNDKSYDAWLLKAVMDFKVENNFNDSMISIKKAKKYSNGKNEWRYSMAFLNFWNSDFREAYKICTKIKDSSYPGEKETLKQVENFNLEILKTNNKKPQLYFWIGYLKFHKEKDIKKAKEYFIKFINDRNSDQYLLEKAKSFINTCK